LAEANEPEDGLAAETVLGLDNVPLDLPVAGVGPRVLAAFLDYLLQASFWSSGSSWRLRLFALSAGASASW